MFRKFKLKSFASLKMISRKVQNEFKIWRVYLQARSPPTWHLQRSLSIALADLVILSGPVSTRYSIFVFVFDICIRIFDALQVYQRIKRTKLMQNMQLRSIGGNHWSDLFSHKVKIGNLLVFCIALTYT